MKGRLDIIHYLEPVIDPPKTRGATHLSRDSPGTASRHRFLSLVQPRGIQVTGVCPLRTKDSLFPSPTTTRAPIPRTTERGPIAQPRHACYTHQHPPWSENSTALQPHAHESTRHTSPLPHKRTSPPRSALRTRQQHATPIKWDTSTLQSNSTSFMLQTVRHGITSAF